MRGSSPRVRGRLLTIGADGFFPRLIPAGAGQTSSRQASRFRRRAHPRGCGADVPVTAVAMFWMGSSPRVRGRPCPSCRCLPRPGLIPAGAGQTSSPSSTTPRQWAHPRGCGADSRNDYVLHEGRGSSPRVRGRHRRRRAPHRPGRLIPAGAGQTVGVSGVGFLWWAHPRGCGADPCQPAMLY